VQAGARPLLDEDGQLQGSVVTWHNVTEQVLAALELRQLNNSLAASEEKYRTLLESLQEGIWLVDENMLTVYVNEPMAGMLGYSVPEMLGQPLSRFVCPDEMELLEVEFNQYRAGQSGQHEHCLRHRLGEPLDVLVTGSPFFDEGRAFRGVIAGVIDMTDRKLILHALEEREGQARRYAAELERSNHELEQFAFIASHDLQEPLRKVKGFSDLLVEHRLGSLDETGRDYLDRITGAASRMQRMINDLLTFSRVATHGQPFETVDLNVVAAEVLSDLKLSVQQSAAVVVLEELPSIRADPTQMYQLFQNLLNNALKYRNPDLPPRITVSAKEDHLAGQPAVQLGLCILFSVNCGYHPAIYRKCETLSKLWWPTTALAFHPTRPCSSSSPSSACTAAPNTKAAGSGWPSAVKSPSVTVGSSAPRASRARAAALSSACRWREARSGRLAW